MAAVFDETSRTSWMLPGTAALALHALVFGWVASTHTVEVPPPAITDLVVEVLSPPPRMPAGAEIPRGEETVAKTATSTRAAAATKTLRTRASATLPVAKIGESIPPSLKPQTSHPISPSQPEAQLLREQAKVSPDERGAEEGAANESLTGTATEAPGSGSGSAALHAASTAGVPGVKPLLLSSGSVCLGLLPASALNAPEKVTLVLNVAKDGSATTSAVRADGSEVHGVVEKAAQACARRLRFIPGRSPTGERIASSSVVRLTFSTPRAAAVARRDHI